MEIEQNKTVSVIMPCYNDGKYIEESIQSVKSQTYQDIELVIINDGSDDSHTIRVLEKLQAQGICVLESKNAGPSGARNIGIKNARGKYILPLDSDDIIEPTYIEKAVDILENNEAIGGVYCLADFFGRRTGLWDLPPYSLEALLVDNVIFVTTVFRKSDWEEIGGFDESLKYGMEDYNFWLSVVERDKTFYQIQEVLFHYRIKKLSRTSGFVSSLENVRATYEKIYYNHRELYLKHIDYCMCALRNNLLYYRVRDSKYRLFFGCLDKIYTMIKRFRKIS